MLLANLQIHSQRQEGWQHRTLNGEVLRQAIEVCGEQVPRGTSSFPHNGAPFSIFSKYLKVKFSNEKNRIGDFTIYYPIKYRL